MTGHRPARPLFEAFPGLERRVPFVQLADLPTPLTPMANLSAQLGSEVWVKRDGLSHPIYGGNKMRKFEFVFGDVLRKRARAILTGGGLGSHHNLAAAVVARQLGIRPVCSYYCQPLSEEVLLNLRFTSSLDVDAHFCGDYVGVAVSFVAQFARWMLRTRRPPYFIYPGASGKLGILGYVNAAFELKAQLDELGCPAPDAVFVAVGSCGTFAGLLLGSRLAGLSGRMIGVRVIEQDVANKPKIARLVNAASRYLQAQHPSVPPVTMRPDEVELLDGYLGPAYAWQTAEAVRAVELVRTTEGLPLETTYTGKAMAALLDYAEQQPGSRLLFIDTYAESPRLDLGDYHALPRRFWPVFDRAHETRCWCLRALRDPSFCWKHASSDQQSHACDGPHPPARG